jgi:outer membrane lipoprotein carrier protein
MRKTLILPFLILILSGLTAQNPVAPAEKSDPEAKKVLDRVRKKYDNYKSFEANFSLVIEVPGQPKDTQKGTVGQQGEKFRLDMDPQIIASDGKTNWIYLKKNNEIQINDADPNSDNGFLTPKDLLFRYEKGDFMYAITDKVTEKSRVLTQIEFKPKDKKSEYAKLRVSIDEKAGTIESIKAFAKDGSRYAFQITRFTPNKIFGADYFRLDAKSFPGAHVEDLRM